MNLLSPADRVGRALLSLALGAPASDLAVRAARTLATADERAWNACLSRLAEHQLLPLAWWGLLHHGAERHVPGPFRDRLQQPFERARVINAVAVQALRDIAETAARDGVALTVCKGIVLAPDYYPELGARPMNDIDMWILPAQRESCARAMHAHGFIRNEPKSSHGADYYENAFGVVFDVHVEMELFSGHREPLVTLTRPAPTGPWRVFEPHALLAHLLVHMNSHAINLGPMLLWLMDLWFVVKKVWPELDPARLRALLPSTHDWVVLIRTVQMMERLADEKAPGVMRPFFAHVAPFELETLWRERRLATWDLPQRIGWARLLACGLGLKAPDGRVYPTLRDLAWWSLDRRTERLAFERAGRSGPRFPRDHKR